MGWHCNLAFVRDANSPSNPTSYLLGIYVLANRGVLITKVHHTLPSEPKASGYSTLRYPLTYLGMTAKGRHFPAGMPINFVSIVILVNTADRLRYFFAAGRGVLTIAH